ncbi:MAG: SoxR reducing system RseC family protein [Gammaproteobacteria bacterium]
MIEEQAQVIEIKGNLLLLQAQTQSACGSCSVSKGCGTSLLAKVVGRKFTHFQAENNINAKVGDTVVVGIAEDALLKGSLMMYILPILCMLFFALLADYFITAPPSLLLAPQRDHGGPSMEITAPPSWLPAEYSPSMEINAATQYSDLMIAACSIMGLVFGSLMSRWYFARQSSVKRFAPVVLRKIIEHGKL